MSVWKVGARISVSSRRFLKEPVTQKAFPFAKAKGKKASRLSLASLLVPGG
jgi:hypothetical protein